jgi:hypothetical protein
MIKKIISALILALLASTVYANPVRALGLGVTEDAARRHAFQRAIEAKVGALILSEVEVNNYNLRKDEIFDYSSGYVDNFKVVSSEQRAGQWLVEVDVWVSESKIANRILSKNNSRTDIDGNRLNQQIRTYTETKQQGDRLLQKVLDVYPTKAFDIELKNSDFKLDARRQLHFVAQVSVVWNKNFVNSLYETLERLQDSNAKNAEKTVLLAKTPNHNTLFNTSSRRTFYFNDVQTLNILNKTFKDRAPILVVSFSNQGKLVHSKCIHLPQSNYFSQGYSDLDIKAFHNSLTSVSVPVYNLNTESITDFKLTIIGRDQC